MSRGTDFATDAKDAGWSADLEEKGGRETVLAKHSKRGLELFMAWDSGRYNYEDSYQVRDGQRRTVRNAAEARRILLGENGAKRTERKTIRRSTTRVRPERDFEAEARRIRPERDKHLPFRISQPDREILAAVLGKEVSWWNEKAKRVECSRIMGDPKQRHLKIIQAKGKRILSWAGVNPDSPPNQPLADCFHAVYLDSILRVEK